MDKSCLSFNDQPIKGNLLVRNFHDNFFIGVEILNYIKINSYQSAFLKSKFFRIQIYFLKEKYTQKQIRYLCKLLIKVLQIFKIIFHVQKFVKALIVLTDFKKALPCDVEYIQPQHVNSGSSDGEVINIWRTEEVIKVFAHELVHYYEIDFFLTHPNPEIINTIKNSFCLQSEIEINLNDIYAEIIANIINSLLYSKIHKMQFRQVFENETYFILYQIAKILKFYQFESFQDFMDRPCSKYVKQTTQLCSYYIMRGALQYYLFHYPDILKLCLQQFNQNQKTMVQYIFETLNNQKFQTFITKCIQDEILMRQRSLKMSMFDIYKIYLKT